MERRRSWHRDGCGVMTGEPVAAPRVQRPSRDRGARLAHEGTQEMYIVQGEKAESQDFIGREQMPEVCAAEAEARGAVTRLVDRPGVQAQARIAHIEPAVARERGAGPAHARGRDAVEEIDAAPYRLNEISRKSDAYEIARMRARQRLVHDVQHLVHVRLRLAHGEATDGISAPVPHADDGARGVAAKIGVNAPLDNGEE